MNERISLNHPTPLVLTQGEKTSPFWAKMKVYLESELQRARKRNDDQQLDQLDTAALRGRISLLKTLIALGDEDRPQTE